LADGVSDASLDDFTFSVCAMAHTFFFLFAINRRQLWAGDPICALAHRPRENLGAWLKYFSTESEQSNEQNHRRKIW
jgi:hypothetical protein